MVIIDYLIGTVLGLLSLGLIVFMSMRLVGTQMNIEQQYRNAIPKKVKYHMGDMVGRRNS